MGNRKRELFPPEMDDIKLREYRSMMARLDDVELRTNYTRQLERCQIDGIKLPQAREIQQLVQIWRELDKRRKSKP